MPIFREAAKKRKESLTHPRWVDAMVTLISWVTRTADCDPDYFRWHASGELQRVEHLRKIVEVAKRLPEVNFWLQTLKTDIVAEFDREGGTFPDNLTVRRSTGAIDASPGDGQALPTARVISPEAGLPQGCYDCPADRPESPDVMRNCRAWGCRMCWDRDGKHIVYRRKTHDLNGWRK